MAVEPSLQSPPASFSADVLDSSSGRCSFATIRSRSTFSCFNLSWLSRERCHIQPRVSNTRGRIAWLENSHLASRCDYLELLADSLINSALSVFQLYPRPIQALCEQHIHPSLHRDHIVAYRRCFRPGRVTAQQHRRQGVGVARCKQRGGCSRQHTSYPGASRTRRRGAGS